MTWQMILQYLALVASGAVTVVSIVVFQLAGKAHSKLRKLLGCVAAIGLIGLIALVTTGGGSPIVAGVGGVVGMAFSLFIMLIHHALVKHGHPVSQASV